MWLRGLIHESKRQRNAGGGGGVEHRNEVLRQLVRHGWWMQWEEVATPKVLIRKP